MAKGISDDLIKLLGEADKRNGLPPGTMFSVMQQETGGNAKYVDDPTTYHYGLNKDGKRIAGHTGKVSTAFGPFGILESTGKDPGYGVQPLKDKSLGEQVRFASDYLAARSKQAGGLQAGLAGYGEGGKYGQQVMARLGKGGATTAPVQVANKVPVKQEVQGAGGMPPMQAAPQDLQAVVEAAQGNPAVASSAAIAQQDPWQEFLAQARGVPTGEPVQVADLQYGAPQMQVQVPDFMAAVNGRQQRNDPQQDFLGFGAWGIPNRRA